MTDGSTTFLDHPQILAILFHPRKAPGTEPPADAVDISVQAPDGVSLGCRFYLEAPQLPHVLFFHGNGEIAADYDHTGPIYTDYELNFLVADYRGYGKSTGTPTVSTMLSDAHRILDHTMDWMRRENRIGPLWLMGRSLGSAPAIELASARPNDVDGLIVESGFADTLELIRYLGLNPDALGIQKDGVFSNLEKIKNYSGPTLIMHAQYDHIIPLDHGRALYDNSPASFKDLYVVDNANHNTIMMMAGHGYFRRIRDFIAQADTSSAGA